jgi:hypothetical protein
MGSSGKKKTTMAKLARENKLRERRLNKQAKKDARRDAAVEDGTPTAVEDLSAGQAAAPATGEQAHEARRAFLDVEPEPSDPRAKEVALSRLRESDDERLALFEHRLRDDARDAGATEQEVREAQRDHPGHGSEHTAR